MNPTQEQVIAWAREAGAEITDWIDKCFGEDVILFDKKQLQAAMTAAYEAGRKDENEACQEICNRHRETIAGVIHHAIRARMKT